MSTSLVAFVVGPLELTAPVDVDGIPLRVAYPPGKQHLTDYAVEVGSFALRFFTDYYGIAYPGDKVDLVAIPDFAFGAMENLGCITFREIALLVDPERATQQELQRVADVINHELAHMWFGDLVTMKWWNGIWLNEAFATFMEMTCTHAFRPEWERWVDFGLTRTGAFDTDALTSTRPVEFEVVSPDDAEGMFDVLTYEKGAAVLRMLEQFLGAEPMRDGIRHYLATHAYGNTETTDLWDAIEDVTGQPVRRVMDSWIFQGGHPVVSAELTGDGSVLRLTQERVRFEGGDEPDEGAKLGDRWGVPLIVAYGSNGSQHIEKVLFEGTDESVQLGFAPEWVLLNAGGHGFYRARYHQKLLNALVARAGELSDLERYSLVDDTFTSVLTGTTTAAEFVDFARGFVDETDLSVWQRLAGGLRAVGRVLDGEALDRYRATIRALAGPALRRMGYTPGADEDGRTRELRATLFELVGVLGEDTDVRARARAIHDSYLADASSVDRALVGAALAVVAKFGGPDEFDVVLSRHRKAPTPQEEMRYLYALARFRDDACFDRMLDLSISEVRSQNAPYLLRAALTNRTHGSIAWEFVRRNWATILSRFPDNSIPRMLDGITALTSPEIAQDVQAFFAEHDVPQGRQTLEQHLERLRVNVALREREAERLAAALA
jgi:puromycin-sensitive aminopeptidase